MRNDKRDATAFFLIPDDVYLVSIKRTYFQYILQEMEVASTMHCRDGDESHCVEMRVSVIAEGVKNMNLYLNHDYLCRGLDFPYWSEDECASI